MKSELFEIVSDGDSWFIRLPAAHREHDNSSDGKRSHLYWTGGTWRYSPEKAMRFSDATAAALYVARRIDQMIIKSTFTSLDIRRGVMTIFAGATS
jgi:hypothetical protein